MTEKIPPSVMAQGDKRARKEIIGGYRKGDKEKKSKQKYEEVTIEQGFEQYLANFDEVTSEGVFKEYLAGLGITSDTALDLKDDFENRNIILERVEEMRGEKIEKEREEKEAKESMSLYTPFEFKLMEKAAKFKELVDKMPALKKYRPVFADGRPLADEQIEYKAKEYAEYLKHLTDNRGKYTEVEIKLLQECDIWNYFYKQIEKNQKYPEDDSGTPLTGPQIKQQAREYYKFKKKNPQEFGELKWANFEWARNSFNWTEAEHKGKKQWGCYKSQMGKDKTGKMVKFTTKYIVNKIPASAKPDQFNNAFYIAETKLPVSETMTLVFVDLKSPDQNPPENTK